MSETKYNNIFVISKDNSGNLSKMWEDIANFIKIAQTQEQVCVIRTEIPNEIVVIEYEHDENIEGWGCSNPRWITDEEWQDILDNREIAAQTNKGDSEE